MNDAKGWLVCYDLRRPARLRKAAKIVECAGPRMQYSDFPCWLDSTGMQKLRWELTEALDPIDDLLMIPLCKRCVDGMETTHSSQNEPEWPAAPPTHIVILGWIHGPVDERTPRGRLCPQPVPPSTSVKTRPGTRYTVNGCELAPQQQ
ncbi:MAG: CRISPR-associated endonuclease Cas2 [Planctomycetia bacterium]